MSYDIVLEAHSETSFPFSKIGGKDPAKVTFTLKEKNGTVIRSESYVVTFDDPVLDTAVPVIFNGTSGEYSINVRVESNISPVEYVASGTSISKQLALVEYRDKREKIVAVFVCTYEKADSIPHGVHVWSVRAGA